MSKLSLSLEALMKARGLEPSGGTFAEPWEARAFALALDLVERGALRWEEFRQRLIEEIARADNATSASGPVPDYYECWLAALEASLTAAGLTSDIEIDRRAAEIAAHPPLRNEARSTGPIKVA